MLSEIYNKVNPSVVGIVVYNEDGKSSMASGVIYSKDGYIVTNDHIYSGISNAKFKIYTSDGKELNAKYIAGDTRSDLAVLKTNSGGLKPMSRQYVHLSKDIETATKVGTRHGDVVILQINTKAMLDDGYALYESDNGVVLTTEVPMKYISFV